MLPPLPAPTPPSPLAVGRFESARARSASRPTPAQRGRYTRRTTQMTLRHRDLITVERDGEEIDVFNWVNVSQPAVVRGGNPTVETFEANIGAGDMAKKPEAVTPWIAEELWHEFSIEVEDYDIEVVNPDNEEVRVL